ncbi:MAG TPA: DUF883 family protein [Cellvibrio sp.]|nr:DUF883 family protein [Cellvibrio sp.]
MQTATNKDSIVKKLGFGSDTCDNVQEKSAEIAKDFRTFIHDVESLIKSTAHLSGEDLAKAKAKLDERVSVAKKSVEAISENIADRAGKTAASANNYVHEKPWPVIGVCAALGFVAGYLLTQRDRE